MGKVNEFLRYLKLLLVAYLAITSITLIACGSSDHDDSNLGNLPTLKVGDTWTMIQSVDSGEYTTICTVTEEKTVGNHEVYIIEMAYQPSFDEIVDTIIMTADRSNMLPIEIRVLNESMGDQFDVVNTYTYEITGSPYFPKKVGNETTLIEMYTYVSTVYGNTETGTETSTSVYKVEQIEDVTVPAGTFKCVKEVEYDETGTAIGATWQTLDAGFYTVKTIDYETSDTEELVSYSIK